jgi:hypothetical protein
MSLPAGPGGGGNGLRAVVNVLASDPKDRLTAAPASLGRAFMARDFKALGLAGAYARASICGRATSTGVSPIPDGLWVCFGSRACPPFGAQY